MAVREFLQVFRKWSITIYNLMGVALFKYIEYTYSTSTLTKHRYFWRLVAFEDVYIPPREDELPSKHFDFPIIYGQ